MKHYSTPLPQDSYQSVGLITAVVGFFLVAYFCIYQQTYKVKDRSLLLELILAVLSAASIGIATFLLGLSVGIHM